MNCILITNQPVEENVLVARAPLIRDWYIYYNPNGYTTDIEVIVRGNVYDRCNGKIKSTTYYDHKSITIPKERFKYWMDFCGRDSLENALFMLTLILRREYDPETYGHFNPTEDCHSDAWVDTLSSIVPNMCCCGNPHKVVISFAKVMKFFSHHPFADEHDDFSLWDNATDDETTIAYMLDAADLIHHGSSLYGGWLSAKGALVVFALELLLAANQDN